MDTGNYMAGLHPDCVYVDMDEARLEGEKRQDGHKHNTTVRFFKDSAHENTLGVAAEIAFSEWSGLEADLEVKPQGDACRDFRFRVGGRIVSVDIKAARAPIFLFLKEKDAGRASDILVLAKVENDEVWFLGWEHKSMMLVSPKKDFGYGITNYFRHHSELRPMWQLLQLIRRK